MNVTTSGRHSAQLVSALCSELILLARHEEAAAADEASRVPYWSPRPASVDARRAAARVLRAEVERLEAEARSWATAS